MQRRWKKLMMVAAASLALSGLPVTARLAEAQTAPSGKRLRPSPTLPLTGFYDTPHPLPPGKPGELIRSERTNQYSLPFELSALRILYHSRTANGEDVAVSGVVLIPDGKTPPDGWPVIAWAHDFRGAARQCAPSLMKNLGVGPLLAMYANLGYAVVATDYAGLGADSGKLVVDMRSNARDVIFSVAAARAAVKEIGPKWIAVGTFQGALAAVAVAESEVRDPNYLGSAATSGLADAAEAYQRSALNNPSRLVILATTLKTLSPGFQVSDLLKDGGLGAFRRATESCESDLGFHGDMLKAGWERNPLVRDFLSKNTPGQSAAYGSLLVISGETDPVIPGDMTAKAVARLCKQGDRVVFLKYANLDASGAVGASAAEQISWIKARFAGLTAPSNCP
jgi:hypothetical protein